MTPRSWLFVPGDAPAKIAKAEQSEADALILDLEDSVAQPRKELARDLVAAALRQATRTKPGGGARQFWVRVNALRGAETLRDLAAMAAAAPDGIVLPKSESGLDVLLLSQHLDTFEAQAHLPPGRIGILPIATETPAAIFNLGTYREAGPRLKGLTWGAEDLSAAVGASTQHNEDGSLRDLYRLSRALCLAGAAAAQVPAIETVYTDFRDLAGCSTYAAQARGDGFTGMLAIHPAQIAVIHAVMSPSADEIAHARRVIALFEATPEAGVVALEGRMLDLPHLLQARRVMAAAHDFAPHKKQNPG